MQTFFSLIQNNILKRISPYLTILAIISFLYLLIVVPAPGLSKPGAWFDDGLFFRWSASISQGDWLGPWDHLTTSKGPLHSLLVAKAAKFSLNPFAYRRVFYLIASLIFISTALSDRKPWLRILTLITLLTDPLQYTQWSLRNLRESTYLPIQLIAFGVGSSALARSKDIKTNDLYLYVATTIMALLFGLLAITREPRSLVWLELSIWAGLFLYSVRPIFHAKTRILFRTFFIISLVFLLAVAPMKYLANINHDLYGEYISNSMEEGEFPRFFSKLSELREIGDVNYIPRVAVKKRALSLALMELPQQSYLRKILDNIDWKTYTFTCNIDPGNCNEMQSDWFSWAIRESAGKLSPVKNETTFQYILRSANNDMHILCNESKTLECVKNSSGFITYPSRWGYTNPFSFLLRETSSVARVAFLPTAFPYGRPDLRTSTDIGVVDKRYMHSIGVKVLQLKQNIKWQRLFVGIIYIGIISRIIMSIILVYYIFLHIKNQRFSHAKIIFDPVAAWIGLTIIAQCLLYVIVSVVSFPALHYMQLTTPMVIGFIARAIDNATREISQQLQYPANNE
jgi:hypothetical protein